jgi:hypothetical protein
VGIRNARAGGAHAAVGSAGDALVARLADPSARVRFFAAQALVHVAPESLGDAQPKELLLALHDLLAAHGDDPTERFAAARALAACADAVTLRTFSEDQEPRVRMGVVLAMRRRARPTSRTSRRLDGSIAGSGARSQCADRRGAPGFANAGTTSSPTR